jgi:group I intron endonuclease
MKKKAVCGIYEIKNTKNGKVYIGSSVNIEKRWYDHSRNLQEGTHQNSYLQRSYSKWGKDSFEFTILEECPKNKRFEREQFYLDKYFGRRSCYNLARSTKTLQYRTCIDRKSNQQGFFPKRPQNSQASS